MRKIVFLFGLIAIMVISIFATALPTMANTSGYTSIDVPGAEHTHPNGINSAGKIVGYYMDQNGVVHGFMRDGENFTTIDFPGGIHTYVHGINYGGKIVGYYIDQHGMTHGFLLDGENFTTFDIPGANHTYPMAINSADQIVGHYLSDGLKPHGFLYNLEWGDYFEEIEYPGALETYSCGINNPSGYPYGKVVGYYRDYNGNTHGFLLDCVDWTTFDFPGSIETRPFGINNLNRIVGDYTSRDPVTAKGHGFSASYKVVPGEVEEFDTIDFPGAEHTQATGINEWGQIVGWYYDRSGRVHGFVVSLNTPKGTNVWVRAGSGVTVTFDEVTGTGNTTATEITCSAAAPSGFRILPFGDPFCYDVETTATYSGTIEVCIIYDDTGVVDESNLKFFVYEDPPGEWVDITTSVDTDNNIICGKTNSLSQFAVMLEASVPGKFDFNDGTTQGWTLQGAYDENGNGAFSSNFIFEWKDYVNYPNPPGGDPPGDNNGSIQLFTMAGHGINNPGATWWIMQFHSPDLSSSITWQTAKGYSVQIAECMAVMTSLSANLYVKVYDIDQNKDRYFHSGTAQELQHDIYGDDIANWNHLTFDWSEISAFPTNYVVKEVFVNIWGKMSGYFEDGVYFDEVIPILGTSSTPDLDGDGDADGLDLAAFASAFGSTSGDLNYNPGADFDNNGCVDESDLAVFATDFSRTGSGPVVYFADAAENPGSVYKVENGTESTYYTRSAGKLYNFAFSPERTLYYSNANDYNLYKLEGGIETLVYTHTTYLRDVAFDSEGRIYFSESKGAGGDGYIYRLEDGVASLYYTVLLSDVGSWAGDFTFDWDDNLYLSNGNIAGANIYKVVDEVPQIVFSAPSNEFIKGISFDSAGNLFYASWAGGNIYQVDLSTGERQLFYSNPDHLWLSDVFVW